ncbi:LacI family DNA-binding transcriptional regulator [Ktedonospora formicarum]|uniref:LacI family transcriptional regulator n=1 Tax=Ktedonospora formicarum TaxID=2778364 RepID=A0A8J3I143_9CHLR|nr:LacI family DNA-binding transcriptional regulator [Ktedonospora formicarum]GHO42984.1 LacI family transcriptional regulator [Ktedonospora formicarum]
MARLVTVKDIAKEAEVSIATVSRVLNNHSNIKDELRQRVLQVAVDLGYFKSSPSSSRQKKRALKEIGFLLTYSDLDEPPLDIFWLHILHGAEIEARKSDIRVTYCGVSLNMPQYELLSKLHAMHLDGILLVGPANSTMVHTIQATNVPLVLVDNYVRIPGQHIDSVLSANFEGTKEAVGYLIEEGHCQIAFLGGYVSQRQNIIYTFERRKEGYLSALSDAHLPIHNELQQFCNISNADDVYAACKRLIDSRLPFSALFCVNDGTANYAMQSLRELGRRVPEDISIVGFDDVDIASHLSPPLTTVRVHKEVMGATAIKSLMARIASPEAVGLTHTIDVDLVKRASVLPYNI